MKLKLATFVAMILLVLVGCSDYEDGPAVSLRSKHDRMTFTRPITYYTVNGADSLEGLLQLFRDSLPNYSGVFHFNYEPGDEEYFVTNREGDIGYPLGGWSQRNDYHQITFGLYKGPFDFLWEVLKLSNRKLWLRQTRGQDVLEVRFEE